MKIWAVVMALSLLGSAARAQSLGEVAKREQVRREKSKREGTSAKVIHEEDLRTAPAKDGKGTFNPASGFGAAPSAGTVQPAARPSPAGRGDGLNEIDTLRNGARQSLESNYERIAANAWSFMEAVQEFLHCRKGVYRSCSAQAARVGVLALAIANDMDQADDAARQGWLTPGEVRAARLRHGMQDSSWDELVRYVNQYRR
jgi:hypothetical protein